MHCGEHTAVIVGVREVGRLVTGSIVDDAVLQFQVRVQVA